MEKLLNTDSNEKHLLTYEENDSPETFFCGKIILSKKISKTNYVCSLIHFILMTFTFVSVDTLQPMLFKSSFYLNVRKDDIGSENANILIIDIIVKIIAAPIYGISADRFGRTRVLIFGYICMCLALFFMPFSSNIYPQFCICRIIYAQGCMAITTLPLLADYVDQSTKGRASALNVIMASLGAVISAYVISNFLTNRMSLRASCMTVAIIIAVIAIAYASGLKHGKYFLNKNKEHKENIATSLAIGFLAAKDKWILLGYVTSFLGRSNSIVLKLFLNLWAKSFYPTGDDGDAEANIQAETLAGICYTIILFFSIAYGLLIESWNKFAILGASYVFCIVGMNLFWICGDCKSVLCYGILAIVGVGFSGLDTISLYLVNNYAWKDHRGKINGVASLFGVFGILVISLLGGYLFDIWSRNAPFLLFEIFTAMGLIILIIICCKGFNFKNNVV